MARFIVVDRAKLEASQRKLEELRAQDPLWQKEKKERERWVAEENARRDAEYAAKRARDG